jgi:hypothetical protein
VKKSERTRLGPVVYGTCVHGETKYRVGRRGLYFSTVQYAWRLKLCLARCLGLSEGGGVMRGSRHRVCATEGKDPESNTVCGANMPFGRGVRGMNASS